MIIIGLFRHRRNAKHSMYRYIYPVTDSLCKQFVKSEAHLKSVSLRREPDRFLTASVSLSYAVSQLKVK